MHIFKNFLRITLTAFLVSISIAACNNAPTQQPKYGKKVRYAQGQPLNFPDVSLEFFGITEYPPSDSYPRSMYTYDFKVYKDSQSQLISWSSGTGDIGPTFFELAGNNYALELMISDNLGPLDENELVLWQVDD